MKIILKNVLFCFRKKQLIIIMRTFIFLCSMMAFSFTPKDVLSQNTKVKIDVDNTLTVDEVFDLIREQTDYKFIYQEGIFKNFLKVKVKKGIISANKLLQKSLSSGNFNVVLSDNNTVLVKEKTPEIIKPQDLIIKGTVTDENEIPLPGVNILVKDKNTGVITDFDGKYSINVSNSQAVLVFSYLGYTTQEIQVKSQNTINVQLQANAEALDEIVVIGYGSVKKSDLTGSISSLKGDALTAVPAANAMVAMQGKVSGVQVMDSGQPGSSPTVRIRGVGTTGNSNPLYVVDGMYMGGVQNINSNDIQSIEVLKDASATAIYGSRGANGVILISTKKGKSIKPAFNLSVYDGYQNPTPFKMVTAKQYGQLINEGNIGQGGQAIYDNLEALGNDTNWFDELAKGGPIRDYQLSFNQKTDNASFYISLGYHKNEGIVNKNAYNRLTLRVNNTYKLSKNVTIGHNVSFIKSGKQNLPMDNLWGWVYRVKPTVSPFDENGNFNDVEVGSNGNVLASIFYTNNEAETYSAIGNAFIDINFMKDFTFKSNFGFDLRSSKGFNFNPVFHVGTGNQKNEISSLSKNWGNTQNWLWENTLTYDKNFDVHHVNAIVGYTSQNNYNESLGGSRSDLFAENESLWFLNAGNTDGQKNSNSASSNAYTSWLLRANYGYDNRYIITGTLRADASSRFPSNNRVGYFPSVAAAWNVSNENFMSNVNIISNLKIRGSWGQIGNDKIGDYSYYPLATSGLGDYAIFGNDIQRGSTIQGLVNSSVLWETAESSNIGFELGLLKNQFSLEVDYYKKTTRDMLAAVGVPGTVGFNAAPGNVGSIENNGIDLSISWKEAKRDFKYGINVTGTSINNKVLDLGSEANIIRGWHQSNWTTVGHSVGEFYGYVADGIFQNQAEIDSHATQNNVVPGDVRFKDIDGDGVITANDRKHIGSPIPKFLAGTNLNFEYKGIQLDIDMYGSFGNKNFNAKLIESYSSEDNYTESAMGRWHGEGTSNTLPRITFGGQNKEVSSLWVQDASFWKIQNVRLAYNFPVNLVKKLKLQKAQIYISGNNLHYFTKYVGPSPEVPNNDVLASGVDRQVYPLVRAIRIGTNITF